MHPGKKQAIVNKLTYVVTHTTDSANYISSPRPKMSLGITDDWMIGLVGETYETYFTLCDMFGSERVWKAKISQQFIQNGVNAMIREILIDQKNGNTDTIPAHLDAFIAECDQSSVEYSVYLPLDNIQMTYYDRLAFGKMTLIRIDHTWLEEHAHQFTVAIPDERQCGFVLEHWRGDVFPLLQNGVAAVYTIAAEPTRAHELAQAEWYRFVDILRYFLFLSFEKRYYIDIGLRGDVRYGVGVAMLLPSTHHTYQTNTSLKSPQPLIISPEVVRMMNRCHVFALADMLDPTKKTSFSDSLFTGVHWVANALTQLEPANEYLSLVSCLETFLTRQRGDLGTIGNAVATGVGWVLGSDLASRLALHKEVKKMYDIRSTISHGGNQEEITSLLPRLREIVADFILQMVHRRAEFRTSGKEGLFDWIDQGNL